MTLSKKKSDVAKEFMAVLAVIENRYRRVLSDDIYLMWFDKAGSRITKSLECIFNAAQGVGNTDWDEFRAVVPFITDIMFGNVFGEENIPKQFWSTSLGAAIRELKYRIDTQIGASDVAKILGHNLSWVWQRVQYLGGVRIGDNFVFDREIIEQFKRDIADKEDSLGGYLRLGDEYWQTEVGKAVLKRQENFSGEKYLSASGVLNIINNKIKAINAQIEDTQKHKKEKSRQWVYHNYAALGGEKDDGKLRFNEKTFREVLANIKFV